jgi:membrane protease YdiL (CAAX protease family)
VWHYPAIFWADYHTDAPRWFNLLTFSIAVLGYSALTAWLRMRSGSLWPVVIWHGLHNLLNQAVFMAMTVETRLSEYLLDDFGLGVMLAGVLLAAIFMRKGSGLGDIASIH